MDEQQKRQQEHMEAAMRAEGVSNLTIENSSAPILVGMLDSPESRQRGVGVQIAGATDDLSLSDSSARNMRLVHVDGDVDRLVQTDNEATVDASGQQAFRVGQMHIGNVGAARDRARAAAEISSREIERPKGKSMASIPELPYRRKKDD